MAGVFSAANIKLVQRSLESNHVHLIYQVTGDATATYFTVAMPRVLCHAVGNISEAAGYNPQVTYVNAATGAVVTYGAAPGSTNKHFLHVWGS